MTAIDRTLDGRSLPLAWLAMGLGFSVGLVACGGDDGEEATMTMAPPPPPPPVPTSSVAFFAADPCSATVPTPTDLFFDETDRSELDACPLLDDPIDAIVELVSREARAPYEASALRVVLPVAGGLDPMSVRPTGTSTLPPLMMLSTASTAAGFAMVEFTADVEGDAIVLTVAEDLEPRSRYVVVATRGLQDLETPPRPLEPSTAALALVGDAAISPSTFPNLDSAEAARLERMRQELRLAIQVLEDAGVSREDIVSIHSFTTRGPPDVLADVVERYQTALAEGRYRYEVVVTQRDITPAEIYDREIPQDVQWFVRGFVRAPRLLDDQLRLRPDWETVEEWVQVPFLMSIPRPRQGLPDEPFKVAVQVVGFGRSNLDARGLADNLAGVNTSLLAIELRCHGRRSPGPDGVCLEDRTDAEAAMLADVESNNRNPLFVGRDQIPDESGIGFFPGDPRQLRDTQIAAVLEIIHVVQSLRTGGAWLAENLNVQPTEVHLIAHGSAALPAAAAAALLDPQRQLRTVQFLAGGASLEELILNGAEAQYEAFAQTLPGPLAGTSSKQQAGAVLQRLSSYLAPVEIASIAERFRASLLPSAGTARALVISPMGDVGRTRFVSVAARQALIDGLSIPTNRVVMNPSPCDDFFLYACRIGQPATIVPEVRNQIATFIDSNGANVVP